MDKEENKETRLVLEQDGFPMAKPAVSLVSWFFKLVPLNVWRGWLDSPIKIRIASQALHIVFQSPVDRDSAIGLVVEVQLEVAVVASVAAAVAMQMPVEEEVAIAAVLAQATTPEVAVVVIAWVSWHYAAY